MAIAFLNVKVHSRSQGHSAVAGSAYRSGEKLIDNRLGVSHDFTNRNDVVFKELLLPVGANEKFLDRELLWNTAESVEKRKDSQVAKDFVLALPKELARDLQIELALKFARTHFTSKGVVVDVAIHDHSDGNPHAHLYVTTRRLLGDAFDRYKARDLNPGFANGAGGKGFINEKEAWNKEWESFQTAFFKSHNLDLIVDPNCSIPQRHQGRIKSDEIHYLKVENQTIKAANREIALNEPEALLINISQQHSVFSEALLQRTLAKHLGANNPKASQEALKEYGTVLAKLQQHPDLFHLGPGDDGQNYYTTRFNLQRELAIEKQVTDMASQSQFSVSNRAIRQILKQSTLNTEQTTALLHITRASRFASLVGYAGTGKSYLLKAANAAWSAKGYQVIGIAPTGIAARNLSTSSNISACTIASLLLRLQHGSIKLTNKHVVVIDEAGMVDLSNWHSVIDAVYRSGAKLVTVGDPAQLQPIGAGGTWRALLLKIGFVELTGIRRQEKAGDRKASRHMARGNIAPALKHYQKNEALHFIDNSGDAKQALINNWKTQLQAKPSALAEMAIIAHRNRDVAALNQLAREQAIALGLINTNKTTTLTVIDRAATQLERLTSGNTTPLPRKTLTKQLQLSIGDRIVFYKNDKQLGVHNGQFATVKALTPGGIITAALDNDKTIEINATKYKDIDYGYAATVHKFQGSTVGHNWTYIDGNYWDSHLAYVALTRHKKSCQIYVNGEQFKDFDSLTHSLEQQGFKDSVLEWPLCYAMRRGLNPDELAGRCLNYLGEKIDRIKDKWQTLFSKQQQMEQHPEKQLNKQEKTLSESIQGKTEELTSANKPTNNTETLDKTNLIISEPANDDWLKENKAEWETLLNSKDSKLQWLSKFRTLYLEKKGQNKSIDYITKSIDESINEIDKKESTRKLLEKLAPAIAKKLPERTVDLSHEKLLTIDDKKYAAEIEKIKDSPINDLRWYAKYYALLQTKPPSKRPPIMKSMQSLINTMRKSPKTMQYLKTNAPKVASLTQSIGKEKTISRERER